MLFNGFYVLFEQILQQFTEFQWVWANFFGTCVDKLYIRFKF